METTESIILEPQSDDLKNESVTKASSIATLKSVADFCNSLPFSGKMITRPAAYNVWKEDNPYYKSIRMVEAASILGVMVWGHSYQAIMGVERLQKNAEAVRNNPSPETIIACGFDIAFATANCAATYAQLHLSGRLADHFLKTDFKSVPFLKEWGIEGENIDYQLVAEKLMTALVNDDQEDIETFFHCSSQRNKTKNND